MLFELLRVYTNETWHKYAQGHLPLAYFDANMEHLPLLRSIIFFPCILKHKTIIMGVVYIMNHEVIPCQMAFFHGHTSTVRFMKSTFYKAYGPLTRCKPNTGQEKRACTKKWMCWYMSKRGKFGNLLHATFSPSSSLLSSWLWQHMAKRKN